MLFNLRKTSDLIGEKPTEIEINDFDQLMTFIKENGDETNGVIIYNNSVDDIDYSCEFTIEIYDDYRES